MEHLLILLILSLIVWWQLSRWLTASQQSPEMNRRQLRINRLWQRALKSMRENRLLAAEKDLLSILKIDDRNARAYTRIGVIYAKQQEHHDAIRCLEIARALKPGPSSLNNLGVIYYQTGQYEKAHLAFKQACELDNQTAIRYLYWAKALNQLKRPEEVTPILEKALKLEPSRESRDLTLDHYLKLNLQNKADQLQTEKARTIIGGRLANRLKRNPRIIII